MGGFYEQWIYEIKSRTSQKILCRYLGAAGIVSRTLSSGLKLMLTQGKRKLFVLACNSWCEEDAICS